MPASVCDKPDLFKPLPVSERGEWEMEMEMGVERGEEVEEGEGEHTRMEDARNKDKWEDEEREGERETQRERLVRERVALPRTPRAPRDWFMVAAYMLVYLEIAWLIILLVRASAGSVPCLALLSLLFPPP